MFEVNNKDNKDANGIVLVSLLFLTYFTLCSTVSIVNFEQVNAGWERLSQMSKFAIKKLTKAMSLM